MPRASVPLHGAVRFGHIGAPASGGGSWANGGATFSPSSLLPHAPGPQVCVRTGCTGDVFSLSGPGERECQDVAGECEGDAGGVTAPLGAAPRLTRGDGARGGLAGGCAACTGCSMAARVT